METQESMQKLVRRYSVFRSLFFGITTPHQLIGFGSLTRTPNTKLPLSISFLNMNGLKPKPYIVSLILSHKLSMFSCSLDD
jgi:hypothetical protein